MTPHFLNFRQCCLVVFLGFLMTSVSGCFLRDFGNSENPIPLEGYPISSTVLSTVLRSISPIPSLGSQTLPNEIAKYKSNGYGRWTYGSGSPIQKKMEIIPGYTGIGVTPAARLLNFFAMTDVHITDKESPAQLIYMTMFNSGIGNFAISLCSGTMLYSTQFLDAAIQTVNALHQQKPVDFGVFLGDVVNSNQYNELRWFIDVVDGQSINPDSGLKDDPIPGPYNDYQDIYKAAGLDKTIPWYQAIGNHDQYWMGSKPMNSYLQSTLIGEDIIKLGNLLLPNGLEKRDFYMGLLDGRTVYGDIFGAGPVASFSISPKVPADSNRHAFSTREFMAEFFKTTTRPVGHGFSQTNIANDFGCYSFEPKSAIPVKVIVLDDTVKENTPNISPALNIYGYGTLDKTRYDWLVSELQEGQANDKLMIVAAHIPIGVVPVGSSVGWWKAGHVTDENLIAELHKYPNFLMWISGHRHLNTIVPFPSPVAAEPERGFWGVETRSLREFPQEFRTFEILRNSDKTVSIVTTEIDPAVKEDSLAELSRSYAIAINQLYGLKTEPNLNAELVKQLTPAMQTKIAGCGTPIN